VAQDLLSEPKMSSLQPTQSILISPRCTQRGSKSTPIELNQLLDVKNRLSEVPNQLSATKNRIQEL